MNKKLFLHIYFFINLQILILGLIFHKYYLFGLGLTNILIFYILNYQEIDYFQNFIYIAKLAYLNISKLFHQFTQANFKNTDNEYTDNTGKSQYISEILEDIINIIRYNNEHYIFIVLAIFMSIVLINHFYLAKYNFNFLFTLGAFLVSYLISYKQIYQGQIYLGNRQVSIKDFLFFLNILVVIFIYQLFEQFIFIDKIFYALIAGFTFYSIGIMLFNFVNKPKLFFTNKIIKLYFTILMLSFVSYCRQNVPFIQHLLVKEIIKENIINKEIPVTTEIIKEKKYLILPDNQEYEIKVDNGSLVVEISGNILKANNISELRQLIQETILIKNNNNIKSHIKNIYGIELTGDLRLKDVIPYLLDKYQIKISTQKNIDFIYISKSNKLYPYLLTAYNLKLIKKNSDPESYIKCKNFVVLIGILENWDITYNAENMFEKYRTEATDKNKLPVGCDMEDNFKIEQLMNYF